MLDDSQIGKLLAYYSLAVSHYDTLNDNDMTMFFEQKIKQTLKLAARSKDAESPKAVKSKQKVAQLKLELHIISKDKKTNEDHKEVVEEQTQVYEENQKAIEKDFMKQDEKFRERLAQRK